jgi:hypothetical protein
MATKCSAIAKSGSRCQTPAVAGLSFCYLHAPEMAERRRAAAVKGGRNRSAKARAAKQIPEAMDAETLAGWLSLLFTSVLSGKVEPRVGTACAAIARTLHEVRHTTELEQRLAELEQAAGIIADRRFG